MTAATVRVDSRLVHGQVVEAWLPALRVDSVVVVDDEAASNGLAQAAMRLAMPEGVTLIVLPSGSPASEALRSDRRSLVLVPGVREAVRLLEGSGVSRQGLVLNVGVVHHEEGRYPVAPGIHLSEGELEMLSRLAQEGITVEVRSLPSQPPLAVEEARQQFLKQRGPDGE